MPGGRCDTAARTGSHLWKEVAAPKGCSSCIEERVAQNCFVVCVFTDVMGFVIVSGNGEKPLPFSVIALAISPAEVPLAAHIIIGYSTSLSCEAASVFISLSRVRLEARRTAAVADLKPGSPMICDRFRTERRCISLGSRLLPLGLLSGHVLGRT